MSVKRRLLINLSANAFARCVGVSSQIVSVPLLLHQWGPGRYAEWVLLNSIPSYLAMSDVGFGNVAGNEMSISLAQGNRQKAVSVFQSVHILITALSLSGAAAIILLFWVMPVHSWFHFHALGPRDSAVVVTLLGISSSVSMQENLLQQGFRCVGKASLGIAVKAMLMLGVLAGVLTVAFLGGTPTHMAAMILSVNVAGTTLLWRMLHREAGWIRFGVTDARKMEIRRLSGPAFSLMAFPFSQLLSVQGVLLVIGYLSGPVAVLIFSTARAVSRSVLQVLQLVNASVWPEMSIAFGASNILMIRKLHRRSCQVSILVCLAVVTAMAFTGEELWRRWTIDQVSTDRTLLNLLLLQMGIGTFWYTSAVVLVATNQHQHVAKVVLGVSCLSLVVCGCLLSARWVGLRGVACALITADFVISFFVLRASLQIAGDGFRGFTRSLLAFPERSWFPFLERH